MCRAVSIFRKQSDREKRNAPTSVFLSCLHATSNCKRYFVYTSLTAAPRDAAVSSHPVSTCSCKDSCSQTHCKRDGMHQEEENVVHLLYRLARFMWMAARCYA